MFGGDAKRGGDRVLESRHLVGLFLGLVLLCGVFFTLGYEMGRSQSASAPGSLVAGKGNLFGPPAAKPTPAEKLPAQQDSPEWDIYSTNAPSTHLETPPKNPPAATAAGHPGTPPPAQTPKTVPASAKAPNRFQPPQIPRGAIVVQVAALTRESDALALADALQQKKFPAYVLAPTTDSFYRVQVGPYPDVAAAEQAKKTLEHDEGLKPIIKH